MRSRMGRFEPMLTSLCWGQDVRVDMVRGVERDIGRI